MPFPLRQGTFARLSAKVRDPIYGNGIALVLNAGVGAGMGFLFWMAAARMFDPAALGFGAAVISAATLAALIGKTGLDAAIVRYVPNASLGMARKLLRRSLLATGVVTTIVALTLLLLTYGPASSLSSLQNPWAAFGFIVLATLTSTAWILDSFFIAEQTARISLLRNIAFHATKLTLLFWTVGLLAGFAVPLVWGVGAVVSLAISVALVPYVLSRRTVVLSNERPTPRDVARYAGQNYALNLAEFAPGLLLPILVLEWLGSEANAAFYLAWTIATVGFLASKAVAQSAFAQLVRDGPAGPSLLKGAKLSLLTLGPFVVMLLVGANVLLGLFGDGYAKSAMLLRLLALSIPAIAVSNHFLAFLKARKTTLELTLVPVVTMIALAILLPFALAAKGVEGVGVAWLLVQTCAGVYALVRLHATLRRNPHGPRNSIHRRAHQG